MNSNIWPRIFFQVYYNVLNIEASSPLQQQASEFVAQHDRMHINIVHTFKHSYLNCDKSNDLLRDCRFRQFYLIL